SQDIIILLSSRQERCSPLLFLLTGAWCCCAKLKLCVCPQQTTSTNPKRTTSRSPTTTYSIHDITQQFSVERQKNATIDISTCAHKIKTITNTNKHHQMHLDTVIFTDVPNFTSNSKTQSRYHKAT
ncbi:unnamed protein product, partial [Heterosigma akashiwo]